MDSNIFADSGEDKLAIVVRLNLYRSLRSTIVANSVVTLEVMFSSEFYDTALSQVAIRAYDLMASFIRTPTKDSHVSASLLETTSNTASNHNVVLCKLMSVNDKTAIYKVRFPSELGNYQLLLFPRPKVFDENVSSSSSDSNNIRISDFDSTFAAQTGLVQGQTVADILPKVNTQDNGICILPLLTDIFELVATSVGMNMTTPLLSCYRLCAGLIIKEDYGHTIGSHVYDSSIVMLRFLNKMLLQSQSSSSQTSSSSLDYTSILTCSTTDVVIELGSGCGLVSIWLALHIPVRVVATDLEAQLPSLRSNVDRNALPLLPSPTVSTNDDGSAISLSQTQTSMTPQLPMVTRLNWTEFRTKMNQQDNNPIGMTDSPVQNEGTAGQTRQSNAHEQKQIGQQVDQEDSNRSCGEHTTSAGINTSSSSPKLSFREAYQSEHMGMTATDGCAMIIACDVLYDRTIVDDFFAVVRSFSKRSPSRTVLLLAQKLRNYKDHDLSTAPSTAALPPTVDVTQIQGFVCHKVWEEAQVVIWEMWMDSD